MKRASTTNKSVGPVSGFQLAVFNKRMESIASKMAHTLLRTARSGVINTARDFSCSLVTAKHEMLCVTEGFPIHMLRGADIMAESMKHFHPELRRGDAFLHNSPYHGNSHAADHTIIVPVVDKDGIHRFTALAKAHLSDCGNSKPTTYMATARDVYEEGALIFAATKIQSDYEDIEDIVRMCKLRIRAPSQWRGDYLAMLGAARIAEREVLKLGEELGWDAFHDLEDRWMDYSEHRMIDALAKLPSGRVSATNILDPVDDVIPEGIAINVSVEVDAVNSQVVVDLTDNPDNLPCGFNLSECTALSAAYCGIFDSIDGTVPVNAGSYRCIKVLLREGCVVGIPRHPSSCSVATTNLADRVVNAVQRAMTKLGDDIGMADAGASAIPPSCGVVSGRRPDGNNEEFINVLILGAGGGPGTPTQDGWLTIACMGNAGMPHYDSIEVDELKYPIHVHKRILRQDSEGAGQFRGAPGAEIEFGPVNCDIEVAYTCDGTIYPAQGALGGLSGATAEIHLRRKDGTCEPQPGCGQTRVHHGESIVSLTAGGGGFGDPLQRQASQIEKDVREGWISQDRAQKIYGAQFDADGNFIQ